MYRYGQVDPRNLWKSYLLALALLFALITSSHFAAYLVNGDGARVAQDINMSGRQRMLSQRIMFFATLGQKNGYLDADSSAKLQSALDLFVTSHETLVSETARKLPKSVHDIYFSADGPMLDSRVKEFAEASQTMLSGSVRGRLIAFLYLRENGPNALLSDLNAVVSAFEDDAKLNARRAEL